MALSVCCAGNVMWRGHCERSASVWTMLYRYLIDRIGSVGLLDSRTGLTASSELVKLIVLVRIAVILADWGTSQSLRKCV